MKKLLDRFFSVTFAVSFAVMFVALMVCLWTPDTGFGFFPQVFATGFFCALFSCLCGMMLT